MGYRCYDSDRKAQFGLCYAYHARKALADVGPHIATMLTATRFNAWNGAYKAGVVSCRSALHVLQKVDCEGSPFLKAATRERYSIWKTSEQAEYPFFQIEQERNSLLKENRSTFLLEECDKYDNEPRLLVGTNFVVGSAVLRSFVQWVLREIYEIEESAFLKRRVQRVALRIRPLHRK